MSTGDREQSQRLEWEGGCPGAAGVPWPATHTAAPGAWRSRASSQEATEATLWLQACRPRRCLLPLQLPACSSPPPPSTGHKNRDSWALEAVQALWTYISSAERSVWP